MSLATRCTACGTIFRVVQDQLRVSEGWVRCGRCAEVFDAREQLFDIDLELPPPWPGDALEAQAEAPPPEPSPAPEPPIPAAAPEPAPQPPVWQPAETLIAADPPAPMPDPIRDAPPPAMHADPRPDARIEPQWHDEAPAPQRQDERDEGTEPPAMLAIDTGPDVVLAPHLAEIAEEPAAAAPQALPEFMRSANGRQRWQRPGVRVALGLGSLLMLALLGLQFAHHFHDAIAAQYPQARPALQALCQLSGCELQAWRRIDAISVESSALSQAGAANQYRLSLSLRNKSAVEVALPWVELNLTDMAGTVVLRRMLAPDEFRTDKALPPKSRLAGGADLPLHVLLSTGEQRIVGYSVEVFHP